MLNTILIILAAVIAVFLIVVAMRPNEFRVTRSIVMNAPASAPFAQVNDFHKWNAWSPWAKMDPMVKNSFEGSPSGVGSVFSWDGNKEVGAGRMTIVESRPNELVKIQLEFFKPFKATNMVEFTFKPEGNGTLVSWTTYGPNNFFTKAIGLIMNCEKMIGGYYEQGLASIKSIVEA